MRLRAECPRCPRGVTGAVTGWSCAVHGEVAPLWRAEESCYESLAEHLRLSVGVPTWLPWPLPLGWQVTDHGVVGAPGRAAQATFASCGGLTDLDGAVEVTLVSEEPGVGLAARCAGVTHIDAGPETVGQPAPVRLEVEGGTSPAWVVPTSDAGGDALDRAVLVAEARGRWLWLVFRPASAALALHQLGALVDVAGLGPELVSVPFGTGPRRW